jgi:2-octaprenyl-6-methoxyphenol hydroxylase
MSEGQRQNRRQGPPSSAGRADVVIAGAGFVGTALAILLAEAGLDVVLADPALGRPPRPDLRASTIAAGPRRLLEAAGVWSAVADRAEPVTAMEIGDARAADLLRPVLLTLSGEAAPGEPFAHVALNEDLAAALAARAAAVPALARRAEAVVDAAPGGASATVRFAGGKTLRAALVVAADGAASPLRSGARIATRGWDYDAASLLTTVALERPHEGRAVQHFLEGGPLALLPLPGQRASVIWTERRLAAARIDAAGDAAFRTALQDRLGDRFGTLALAGRRAMQPLRLQVAAAMTGERLALIGDAAHVLHPLAGQGLNLGFADVAALAEAIVDAGRLGSDIGAADVLADYRSRRRFDVMAMVAATDGLARLFGARGAKARALRDAGMGVVERAPALKNRIVEAAAAVGDGAPRLLRGEAL